MQLNLSAPVAPPPVAAIHLQSAAYGFDANSISVTWLELDAHGNTIQQRSEMLSAAQVAAFFATPVATAPNLQAAFVAAFVAAVAGLYAQSVTLASP